MSNFERVVEGERGQGAGHTGATPDRSLNLMILVKQKKRRSYTITVLLDLPF